MKAMGAVPGDYRFEGGQLRIAGRDAEALIAEAGDTPCFVYDSGIVAERILRLRNALGEETAIHYAIKANPYSPLLAMIASLVDGLDVASGGELALAATFKDARAISFAGPGKRDDELEAAIHAGATINLESPAEGARALAIGQRAGRSPRLAIRVNPDFELRGAGMRMGGRASPFGMEAAAVSELVARIDGEGGVWEGLHIFAGSQALDSDAIIETQGATLALAARIAGEVGRAPPLVNLGGGFGIPYFAGEAPVDVERIGAALIARLASRPVALADSRFAIELGRWLVGEAGVYLSRIVDRKVSQGEIFLVVDGGLHHQLAASGNFGTVVRRNYPLRVANPRADAMMETVTIVGCLCTPLDRLGEKVALPRAEVGDVIAVFMAGAYGATASPAAFLGHSPARELLVGAKVAARLQS